MKLGHPLEYRTGQRVRLPIVRAHKEVTTLAGAGDNDPARLSIRKFAVQRLISDIEDSEYASHSNGEHQEQDEGISWVSADSPNATRHIVEKRTETHLSTLCSSFPDASFPFSESSPEP
jgi:hypothetical protein